MTAPSVPGVQALGKAIKGKGWKGRGPTTDALTSLVARYARTHGPFLVDDLAARFGISADRATGALVALEAEDRVVHGEFRPNGSGREWCDGDVLRLATSIGTKASTRGFTP